LMATKKIREKKAEKKTIAFYFYLWTVRNTCDSKDAGQNHRIGERIQEEHGWKVGSVCPNKNVIIAYPVIAQIEQCPVGPADRMVDPENFSIRSPR
jgi:hypothetical protein